MEKYKGYTIPETVDKEALLAYLEAKHCGHGAISTGEKDCNTPCAPCFLSTIQEQIDTRRAKYQFVIEYAIDNKYISKADALKFTLDSRSN